MGKPVLTPCPNSIVAHAKGYCDAVSYAAGMAHGMEALQGFVQDWQRHCATPRQEREVALAHDMEAFIAAAPSSGVVWPNPTVMQKTLRGRNEDTFPCSLCGAPLTEESRWSLTLQQPARQLAYERQEICQDCTDAVEAFCVERAEQQQAWA